MNSLINRYIVGIPFRSFPIFQLYIFRFDQVLLTRNLDIFPKGNENENGTHFLLKFQCAQVKWKISKPVKI